MTGKTQSRVRIGEKLAMHFERRLRPAAEQPEILLWAKELDSSARNGRAENRRGLA